MRIKVCDLYIYMRIKVPDSLVTTTRDSIDKAQCYLAAKSGRTVFICLEEMDGVHKNHWKLRQFNLIL
jgi:hypothetical protein